MLSELEFPVILTLQSTVVSEKSRVGRTRISRDSAAEAHRQKINAASTKDICYVLEHIRGNM